MWRWVGLLLLLPLQLLRVAGVVRGRTLVACSERGDGGGTICSPSRSTTRGRSPPSPRRGEDAPTRRLPPCAAMGVACVEARAGLRAEEEVDEGALERAAEEEGDDDVTDEGAVEEPRQVLGGE
jgi:hypothetical protein